MSDLHEHLQRYLTSVLGESVGLRPVEEMRLPLYLEAAYELWRGTLFGSPVVLAVERYEGREATPGQLARELAALREAVGSDRVALVLTNLPSRERRRLVQQGVPFIVPGRQLHLPMFLVDLREHFPRSRSERPSSLAWASQLLLIRHLLRQDVEGRSLSELANLLGYAAMTLTNVRDELTRAELCAVATRGRSKHLRFPADRRETWERALPLLRSPVRGITGFLRNLPASRPVRTCPG